MQQPDARRGVTICDVLGMLPPDACNIILSVLSADDKRSLKLTCRSLAGWLYNSLQLLKLTYSTNDAPGNRADLDIQVSALRKYTSAKDLCVAFMPTASRDEASGRTIHKPPPPWTSAGLPAILRRNSSIWGDRITGMTVTGVPESCDTSCFTSTLALYLPRLAKLTLSGMCANAGVLGPLAKLPNLNRLDVVYTTAWTNGGVHPAVAEVEDAASLVNLSILSLKLRFPRIQDPDGSYSKPTIKLAPLSALTRLGQLAIASMHELGEFDIDGLLPSVSVLLLSRGKTRVRNPLPPRLLLMASKGPLQLWSPQAQLPSTLSVLALEDIPLDDLPTLGSAMQLPQTYLRLAVKVDGAVRYNLATALQEFAKAAKLHALELGLRQIPHSQLDVLVGGGGALNAPAVIVEGTSDESSSGADAAGAPFGSAAAASVVPAGGSSSGSSDALWDCLAGWLVVLWLETDGDGACSAATGDGLVARLRACRRLTDVRLKMPQLNVRTLKALLDITALRQLCIMSAGLLFSVPGGAQPAPHTLEVLKGCLQMRVYALPSLPLVFKTSLLPQVELEAMRAGLGTSPPVSVVAVRAEDRATLEQEGGLMMQRLSLMG